MSREREIPTFSIWRLVLIWLLMLCCFGALSVRLWNLQVAQGTEFQRKLAKQSLRSVRLPGIRGRILDRNGVVLAENRPSYCISIYLEEFRRSGGVQRTVDAVMEALYRMAEQMDRPLQLGPKEVRNHMGRRTPLPLVVWRDLDETAVARFSERAMEFPGTALTVEPVRVYPRGTSACHLMGYVGRLDESKLAANSEDSPEKFHYYLPEMSGKSGIEKQLDDVLRAFEGGQLMIQVDVAGFKFDEVSRREPQKGSDVQLTLDSRIQRAAETVLKGQRGAVVVVNPRSGDVLALASQPGFNPNDFSPSVPASIWNALRDNPARPLYNRATGGEYAPGSTFKPVTLLATLQSGKGSASTLHSCPGFFNLGTTRFRCWQSWGHGNIDMKTAIRTSCNVYLFYAALAAGPDAVQAMARNCGFGRATGINLDFERPGLVPDNEWKRRERRDGWRDGDTCNVAIGQGALLVTPLQMGLYTATLANSGTLWKPRLVRRVISSNGATNEIPVEKASGGPRWEPRHIETVRSGMRDAVNASDGSGKRARLDGIVVAAKTGTAEYGIKGAGRKMTWMIAFAPYEAPRYAVALLVEDGVSGGTTAAPRMKHLLTQLFNEVEGMNLPPASLEGEGSGGAQPAQMEEPA